MNVGDLVVMSDYWDNELAMILTVEPEKNRCTVVFSQSLMKEVFSLSFLRSLLREGKDE